MHCDGNRVGRGASSVRNRSFTVAARLGGRRGFQPHRLSLCWCDRCSPIRSCFWRLRRDRKSTRLNSSHLGISYAVFCLKKKPSSISYQLSHPSFAISALSLSIATDILIVFI